MQPEHWDMEKSIAMCVQEEERIKMVALSTMCRTKRKSPSMPTLPHKQITRLLISKRTFQWTKMSASTAIKRGITRKIVPLS